MFEITLPVTPPYILIKECKASSEVQASSQGLTDERKLFA